MEIGPPVAIVQASVECAHGVAQPFAVDGLNVRAAQQRSRRIEVLGGHEVPEVERRRVHRALAGRNDQADKDSAHQSNDSVGPAAGMLEGARAEALTSQERAHTDNGLDHAGRDHDVRSEEAGGAPGAGRYFAGPCTTSKVKRPSPSGVTISRPAASGASVWSWQARQRATRRSRSNPSRRASA